MNKENIPVFNRDVYRNFDCNSGMGVTKKEDETFYKFFNEYRGSTHAYFKENLCAIVRDAYNGVVYLRKI